MGVKLLPPPPRGFRELSWTRPLVYEIPFDEKIFLDRSKRGGGSNLTPTVNQLRVLWSWCSWCTQRAPLVKNCFLQGVGGKSLCWIILSQLYIFSSIITSSRYMSWIENLTTCIENYVSFHFKPQMRELKLFEKVSSFFFASSCTLLISNWRCFLKVFFEVRKSCTRIQKDTYQLPAKWWKIKMSWRFLFDVYHRFLIGLFPLEISEFFLSL